MREKREAGSNKISSEIISMTNRTLEEGGRLTVKPMNRERREGDQIIASSL